MSCSATIVCAVVAITSGSPPGRAAGFAASATGAKEVVAQLGAHTAGVPARSAGGSAAPGPLTLASAPQAPGRLGREDARASGGEPLQPREYNRSCRSGVGPSPHPTPVAPPGQAAFPPDPSHRPPPLPRGIRAPL